VDPDPHKTDADPKHCRTGQLKHDGRGRKARVASDDRAAKTGQPGQGSQDRTARTGQPGQDSQDKPVKI
jgi:hypothetical protein